MLSRASTSSFMLIGLMFAHLIAIEYCVTPLAILRLCVGADIVFWALLLPAVDLAALPHVDGVGVVVAVVAAVGFAVLAAVAPAVVFAVVVPPALSVLTALVPVDVAVLSSTESAVAFVLVPSSALPVSLLVASACACCSAVS